MTGNPPQLIELFVHSTCDDISLAKLGSGLRMHSLSEIVKKLSAVTHIGHHIVKRLHSLSAAKLHYRISLAQTAAKLHNLTRHYLSGCRSGNDPLKVAYLTYHCLKTQQIILIINKMLNHRISVFQFLQIHNRHRQPGAEHTGSHRRRTLVHHFYQRCPFLSCRRSEYLQIAECESVHPHKSPLVYTRYRTYICQLLVLSLFQIYQQGTCRCDSKRKIIYSESFQ